MRPESGAGGLLTTAQAADLLGVRVPTVYAYVSRGLLTRVDGTSRHDGSCFRSREVLALARRRHRPRTGTFELAVDSGITLLDPAGRLSFRGQDVERLAEHSDYEATADLLWQAPHSRWNAVAPALDIARKVARATGAQAPPAQRIRLACAMAAEDDRFSAEIADEVDEARQLILAAAHSLSAHAPAPGPEPDGVAHILWHALTPGGDEDDERIVHEAMILLADHELATSSLTARAAASTGASLGHAMCAGLAAMAGPRHGRASCLAERLLDRSDAVGVSAAVDELTEPPAGFGHVVYRDVDPRAEHLLARLAARPRSSVPMVDDLSLAVYRRFQVVPNVDVALAAMVRDLALPEGSGEAVFALARMAGLAAHVMEERGRPLRFRPRAVYTGDT